MFKCINIFSIVLLTLASNAYADKYINVGRTATSDEVIAWDIDVRPDFKGLPVGSGSVSTGQQIWEKKCATCHGAFAESNEVFTPLVGGTTKEDIATGRVASLVGNSQPQRTALMKLATLSTLWDYIHRAMPWTAPKSLTNDEVFAVTAYILNLAEIIPEDFTLTDKNIVEVQKLMPNRNGMTLSHGMRQVSGKPDVRNVACMTNCVTEVKIKSALPDSARNVHGNIQQQNRIFGAVRGADTTKPISNLPINVMPRSESFDVNEPIKSKTSAQNEQEKVDMYSLAKKSGCMSCHGTTSKVVGPGFSEIASKYKSDTNAEPRLVMKVRQGGNGSWGSISMPAQTDVSVGDIKLLVNWILKESK
jgi:S-disulfanyl-L-cysteine oxidoreductase SoxD